MKPANSIPFEPCPEHESDPIWRFSANPIISRDHVTGANSIFNSAVIPWKDGYLGVFRIDDKALEKYLHLGYSKDGISWDIEQQAIVFANNGQKAAGYDPRLVKIENKFYITWCNSYHGPTIGVAVTEDFSDIRQLQNAFLPFNRNGVLFPEKINGNFAMLSRPSDNGHTPFGDIFYSESPDMTYWGNHRHVMSPFGLWAWTKVGAGPIPIRTEQGWLFLFHGVQTTCNGFIYSIGTALLDSERPWEVIARAKPYAMAPREGYECTGDVPNVVFPCAALHDESTGNLAVYYGAADTVVALAFSNVNTLLDFIKNNPE